MHFINLSGYLAASVQIKPVDQLINYADDAVLFTDDPTKLDKVFQNFKASAGVMGLHTNWQKNEDPKYWNWRRTKNSPY